MRNGCLMIRASISLFRRAAANPVSIILAFRWKAQTNYMKSMRGCDKQAATLSSKAKRLAAMRNQRNRGLTIRRASHGKPSTPRAKALSTAMVPAKTAHASRMRNNRRAALLRKRQLLPRAAGHDGTLWLIAPIMCCSYAPEIRRARSSRKRS